MDFDKHGWDAAELRQFTRLVNMTSSRDQMARIEARLDMQKFVERVGKDKCDAMFAHLQKQWAEEEKLRRKRRATP